MIKLKMDLIQRCNDAYWELDSDHTLSDARRMEAVFETLALECEEWAATLKAEGSNICSLAVQGVADNLRTEVKGIANG